ncbi:MAG: HesA/MoeB/ThiF family protein [Kiritimatiellia bacterium]|jgi:adenylyltransferase/sulfurtransferase|nr:HesA/MoeB/ThiF family protein [Kiritimatiellia bacterium]
MAFSPEERQRYARHLDLPGFGGRAQEKLRAGRILVVGCGGLGSPALYYLAAAGVGRLGLIDSDQVDISNLQRQILHGTADIGRAKTDSAVARLRTLNPHVGLAPHSERLCAANARELFAPYDIILDATDNYATKYLINDICVATKKPFIHAGISAFGGQLLTVLPGQSACLRCIFPDSPPPLPPDGPANAGPLGPIPGVIGSLQAVEAIKFLTGVGTLLSDTLLTYDGLAAVFTPVPAHRNPACPACGTDAQPKD